MRMMWKTLVAAVLSATFILGSATPAAAQTTLQPINSARDKIVVLYNNRPIATCETRWESVNRLHRTCTEFVTVTVPLAGGVEYRAGDTYDFIYYDGTIYSRMNADTRWEVTNDPFYSPNDTILGTVAGLLGIGAEESASVVGTATVEGVATTQIQFWFAEEDGERLVTDLFLDSTGLARSYAISIRSATDTWQEIVTLQDINTPIKIAAPNPELVNW